MADPVYYGDYLKLDRLLGAQEPLSAGDGDPVHDEMLFIIVHQAYELWFKQILWELEDVISIFEDIVDEAHMLRVVARLERIGEIQRLLLAQIDVLETMTPLDFLEFRDYLFPASGFQSVQFRLIENRLGVRPQDRLTFAGAPYTARFSPADRARVEAAEREPSLFDRVEAWLERTPFLDASGYSFWDEYRKTVGEMLESDRAVVEANPNLTAEEKESQLASFADTMEQYEAIFDPDRYAGLVAAGERRLSHRAFQAALFIELYRDQPALHEPFRMITLLMDIDEGLTTWRYRHALMALRMIGQRVGTGGSAGASYLMAQAERSRVFGDLFALATFLIPRSRRPELPAELVDMMRFRYE